MCICRMEALDKVEWGGAAAAHRPLRRGPPARARVCPCGGF
jgi:hypothetical protein